VLAARRKRSPRVIGTYTFQSVNPFGSYVHLIPGFSFSWRRHWHLQASGASIPEIGIPLSQSGRQRKVGRGMGCGVLVAIIGSRWPVLRFLV